MYITTEWTNEVMDERKYSIYCCAWCSIQDSHLCWAYDEYQLAGNNGIIFC